ncbi:MAG: A/G-specific adenine glycosylase, partial [Tenericutes bacterium HGW-Tenericutes-7]
MIDVHRLESWYIKHKRKLSFRDTKNPYFIWVSEIMLQQTQVDTVIPYFERWIKNYPTIEDVAKA